MNGKIIKIISNDYTVLGEDNKEYICKARGKFRNMKVTPLVGDIVTFDKDNRYIMKIHPRNNYLIRPSIANIDQLIIIASVNTIALNILYPLFFIIASVFTYPLYHNYTYFQLFKK